MAFDDNWEKIFSNKSWGKYPAEELIRFIARNYYSIPDRKKIKILDLGCGGGASLWYLARESFTAYGIDGSNSAIKQSKDLLTKEGYKANLIVGDFLNLDYPDNFFDVVIDMNSIQHNRWEDIQRINHEIYRILKPNGRFFGMMVNSETSGCNTAQKVEYNTYRDFREGFITSNILIHLTTYEEIISLMKLFKNVIIYKTMRTDEKNEHKISHFVVEGKKNE